jgi:hypothetical protein
MTDERRKIVLGSKEHREWVGALVATYSPGSVVTLEPPRRTLDQNALFHSLCGEIAKAKPQWNGFHMDAEDWKALLIVSHAVATKEDIGMRLVPDLEGHGLVQLRESSARMSKVRATSLIDYVIAWATTQGIDITVPERAAND